MAKYFKNFKALLLLSLGHLTTDIFQGSLPAILPFLKDRLDLSYTMAGVIMITANFTSSLIQPLFGYISDKKDKPLLLPFGILAAGAGYCLLAFAPSYAAVLVFVVVSGLGVAAYHPEGYKTASFFTGERKVTGMAIFSVGGNLGFAVGPILSISIITGLGFAYLPLMMALALLCTGLILVHWGTLTTIDAKDRPVRKGGADKVPIAWIPLALVVGVVIVRSWIQFGLMTYIPFYYINFLQGDPVYAGKLVTAFLVGGAMGTLGGAPLADRWGHKTYLIGSMALAALLLPGILFVEGIFLFAILALLGLVVISTFTVTLVMAQHLLPGNLGIASGLTVGLAIGSGGICVTLLGVLADAYGVPMALRAITVLPLLGLFLAVSIRYPEQRRTI